MEKQQQQQPPSQVNGWFNFHHHIIRDKNWFSLLLNYEKDGKKWFEALNSVFFLNLTFDGHF